MPRTVRRAPTIATIITKKRRTFELPVLEEGLAPPVAISVEWAANDPLICPIGSTEVFGRVPEIRVRNGTVLPAGNIYLRYGNQHFGFFHIWRRHFTGIADQAVAIERVRREVAEVLKPGTEIRHEAGTRAAVLKVGTGMVIIELRHDVPPCYSVVTGGWWNPTNTKGSVIGALV